MFDHIKVVGSNPAEGQLGLIWCCVVSHAGDRAISDRGLANPQTNRLSSTNKERGNV